MLGRSLHPSISSRLRRRKEAVRTCFGLVGKVCGFLTEMLPQQTTQGQADQHAAWNIQHPQRSLVYPWLPATTVASTNQLNLNYSIQQKILRWAHCPTACPAYPTCWTRKRWRSAAHPSRRPVSRPPWDHPRCLAAVLES